MRSQQFDENASFFFTEIKMTLALLTILMYHIYCSAAKPAVISVKPNRQLLLQFHSEYTSITDELENVCHMITSPTLSLNRESSEKSRSNAAFAALLEKKHLQECEESDYLMLSKLFHNRDSINDSEDAFADVCHSS